MCVKHRWDHPDGVFRSTDGIFAKFRKCLKCDEEQWKIEGTWIKIEKGVSSAKELVRGRK